MRTMIPGNGIRATWMLPVLFLSLGLTGCVPEKTPSTADGPLLSLPDNSHDFGTVTEGTRVEYSFPVSNRGSEELRFEAVKIPENFDRAEYPASLMPDEAGTVALGFSTTGVAGSGTFRVQLLTNETENSRHVISLKGKIVSLVEILPQNRVYFLDIPHGQGGEQQLTILNHQDQPLRLEVASQAGGSFSAALETVRDGAEYRLRIVLDPAAPAGRFEETIELVTDSPRYPKIPVYARASIVGEVFARPREVSFSRVRLADLYQEVLALKRVRVAKRDAADFEVVAASTDAPFISVEVKPEVEGQSYLVFVQIDPARASKGEWRATLTVRTNDPRFPELEVPLTGNFL